MNATERLRELLGKRNIFWTEIKKLKYGWRTCWKTDDDQDGYCYFDEELFGVTSMTITGITPEQAIAATLGAETCHDASDDDWRFECSKCGYDYDSTGGFGCDFGSEPDFSYCPHCGRRVVQG